LKRFIAEEIKDTDGLNKVFGKKNWQKKQVRQKKKVISAKESFCETIFGHARSKFVFSPFLLFFTADPFQSGKVARTRTRDNEIIYSVIQQSV
jgi:hypothetical protein